MLNITKKNHYVWRYYLKQWSRDDKIFAKIDKKIINTDLMNVGQERYFYELFELSEADLLYANALVEQYQGSSYDKIWIKNYDSINSFYKIIKEKDIDKANYLMKQSEEIWYQKIEDILKPSLMLLYDEKLNPFKDKNIKESFTFAVSEQYVRTKRIKNGVVGSIDNDSIKSQGINPINIFNLMKHFLAVKIAISLLYTDYNYYLLKNENGLFITGDQPIINTKMDYNQEMEPVDFELYYPITPKLAVLITKDKKHNVNLANVINDEEAKYYNNLIENAAFSQVYSDTEEKLKE